MRKSLLEQRQPILQLLKATALHQTTLSAQKQLPGTESQRDLNGIERCWLLAHCVTHGETLPHLMKNIGKLLEFLQLCATPPCRSWAPEVLPKDAKCPLPLKCETVFFWPTIFTRW